MTEITQVVGVAHEVEIKDLWRETNRHLAAIASALQVMES